MNDLTLALVQTTLHWEDRTANLSDFDALLPAAQGADVVILPEMFTTGFSMAPERLWEAADGPTRDWLLAQARALDAAVTGSVIVRNSDGQYVNRLYWAQPDGTVLHYDKRHLFRMANEHQRYGAGRQREIVELNGWRVCPQVCYDLRFPVFLRNRWDRATERYDYDLLLFVANWPRPRRDAWRTLLRARAIENLACVAGVNRVGTDGNGIDYAGDSAVIDASGQLLAELGPSPATLTMTLSGGETRAWRERFPAYRDADEFELRP